jgi:hypothetical protein
MPSVLSLLSGWGAQPDEDLTKNTRGEVNIVVNNTGYFPNRPIIEELDLPVGRLAEQQSSPKGKRR